MALIARNEQTRIGSETPFVCYMSLPTFTLIWRPLQLLNVKLVVLNIEQYNRLGFIQNMHFFSSFVHNIIAVYPSVRPREFLGHGHQILKMFYALPK